jgi:hypothetical protein
MFRAFSEGATQAAFGILRAEISRYLKVLMHIVIKAYISY